MSPFPSAHKDDSEGSTGLIFMRVYNKWHGEIKKRLKSAGITHPQFVVITTLGYMSQFQEEITQVMIANMAGMDVMSVSQILILLEKKGIIERRAHSKDTRANAILLTPKGSEVMMKALPIVEEIDNLFFGSLGEREVPFQSFLNTLKQYEFK